MSGQNYSENSPEGDWDEKGHLAWNEYDWKRYLNNSEEETSRFLSLYLKMRNQASRLDDIAHTLGWDREDMGGGPYPDDTQSDELTEPLALNHPHEEFPDSDEFDPYTIHRHPVFIVTRALYKYMSEGLDLLIELESAELNARTVHLYHRSLSSGEHNAIMAVNALDMGDFNLCICHLKSALSILNQSLAMLQQFPSSEAFAHYANDATAAIFDLRELWLRVLHECREEHKRDFME